MDNLLRPPPKQNRGDYRVNYDRKNIAYLLQLLISTEK